MNARRVGVGTGLLITAGAIVVVLLSTFGQAPSQTETGLVVAVDSSGLTNVRGFSIRTHDGRTVAFKVGVLENGAEFPPGHLLEHAATGVRVVVTYRQENGVLVAIRLDDAPGVSTAAPTPAVPSPT